MNAIQGRNVKAEQIEFPFHVTLVGTSHVYQWAQPDSEPAAIAAFFAFLEELALSCGAVSIAEEMSRDALAQQNREESNVEALSRRLGLKHAYCDPGAIEQQTLGVVNEGNILYEASKSGWTDTEVQKMIQDGYRLREHAWLNKLQEFAQWPTLFVCGKEHVELFAALLVANKIAVTVAAVDWCH
jgi:hypothetical protein